MSAIEEIICSAREAGASDVHLAAGIPPKMRIGGELFSMNCSRLTGADMLDILIGIMPEAFRGRFEERGEYAFSFTLPQGGRCRANAYKQRESVALAIRLIESEILLPEEMGIPETETMIQAPQAEAFQGRRRSRSKKRIRRRRSPAAGAGTDALIMKKGISPGKKRRSRPQALPQSPKKK